MNVMLEFICIGFVELRETGGKRKKIQNERYVSTEYRPSDTRIPTLRFRPLGQFNSRRTVFYTLTVSWHLVKPTHMTCNECMKLIMVWCVDAMETVIDKYLHLVKRK